MIRKCYPVVIYLLKANNKDTTRSGAFIAKTCVRYFLSNFYFFTK